MRDKHLLISLLVGMALMLGAVSVRAQTGDDTAAPIQRDCFRLNDWRGWKAPNADQIYLKVGMHQVYRLDLSYGSNFLRAPGMHLVTKVHGSDIICSPVDLDLSLASYPGIPEHLFIKTITKMTEAEIAAIAPEDRP